MSIDVAVPSGPVQSLLQWRDELAIFVVDGVRYRL
jgi:hypothetical protein